VGAVASSARHRARGWVAYVRLVVLRSDAAAGRNASAQRAAERRRQVTYICGAHMYCISYISYIYTCAMRVCRAGVAACRIMYVEQPDPPYPAQPRWGVHINISTLGGGELQAAAPPRTSRY